MDKHAKIYVAGHRGLVGSSLMRLLLQQGYTNIIVRTFAEVDLRSQQAVNNFFAQERPDYVFLAAAKVGGIGANKQYPASFIYDNLMIQTNIIHVAHTYQVKKLLFLGSSCIYPRMCPQPIKEDYLLTSTLEPTNEPYAIAKIAGLKLCQSYVRQYGDRFITAMPTNLYGPGDTFDEQTSHVIPALLYKFHQAVIEGRDHVMVWGSGVPRREFLFVDDLAQALVFLMKQYESEQWINVGVGRDISIAELAYMIQNIVGFKGEIVFDATKPDGTPRKVLDVSRINEQGWHATTSLENGLKKTYAWFVQHHSKTKVSQHEKAVL